MQDNQQPQVNSEPMTNPAPQAPVAAPAAVQDGVKKGKYQVKVIREKCISAVSCVHIAGNTFELDEENIAIVKQQNGDDDETILLGAQSCPTGAIIVIDTETGEQVWPKE